MALKPEVIMSHPIVHAEMEPVTGPGVSFALFADPQGHVVGLAHQR